VNDQRNRTKRAAGRRPRSSGPDTGTRTAILAAARSVFARRGFEGASTRHVARIAGVNNAMIYYHFNDKDQLYRAVLADSFSAFERIWDHGIFTSSATASRKIAKFIEEFIRFQHRNEDLRKIMSMEFANCSQNYRWLADTYFIHSYARLENILREGVRSGELKKCDPSLVIPSLVGMIIHSYIMRPIAEHVTGRKVDLTVSRFGRFVTDMIFNGLKPVRR
jgi:AcrR family transcriptional regulator